MYYSIRHNLSVRKPDFCFETKSHSVECFAVVIICRHYLGAMNIKDSVDVPEEMCKF